MVLLPRCGCLNNAVHFLRKHLLRRTVTVSVTVSGCPTLTKTNLFSSSSTSNRTKKVVYVSSSKNIFENLALEQWLYENVDMTDTDYLLLWRNGPAVVIGRHQNPWLECNVQEVANRGASLARRNSGGGTVYHDEGNLNLSFLMHRSHYDRRRNLSLVVAALTSHWDLDIDLNNRDDLILDGVYKVSGTASKLGGNRTYHHFTLVFDVDKDVLASVLYSPVLGVDSKATKSVPSPVKNLKEEAPDMTYDSLVKVIGQLFMGDEKEKDFTPVDPTDQSRFPGVASIRRSFESWDWVFGKSPSFSITRTFARPAKDLSAQFSEFSLRTEIAIEKGRLRTVSMELRGKRKDSNQTAKLPFKLLEVVDVAGEPLERTRMAELWERCWSMVREREGEEDYELLAWGLECLILCVPVGGGGDVIES